MCPGPGEAGPKQLEKEPRLASMNALPRAQEPPSTPGALPAPTQGEPTGCAKAPDAQNQ
jgi:hypothetical protein